MGPLELVKLTALMGRTSGKSKIRIGLIDGPVAVDHPGLFGENIHVVPGSFAGACSRSSSIACIHGTFVAGVLCANRESGAPAICPSCTLVVRPIFGETSSTNGSLPNATPQELAAALIDCIDSGVCIVNLSIALAEASMPGRCKLQQCLDYAARRNVLIVAAAGNQGTVGSSLITRHPWVIPVAACDLQGRPTSQSNLGRSIGRRGVCAPGDNITSLDPTGGNGTYSGTSAAAPFVTGAIALLWSEFPEVDVADLRFAVLRSNRAPRTSVAPPLLDVDSACQWITTSFTGGPR